MAPPEAITASEKTAEVKFYNYSFVVKKRAQKTARNISKNTAIIIPEHFVPSFKPAKVFVDKVKTGNKESV